jgi:prolyl-tRNA synthetase
MSLGISANAIIIVNIIKDSDEYAKQVYRTLKNLGIDVLFDDTSDSAGQKFAKADLLGIPKQIIVSQKLQDSKSLEIKDRKTGIKTIISLYQKYI